jgi:hypothetical protein
MQIDFVHYIGRTLVPSFHAHRVFLFAGDV